MFWYGFPGFATLTPGFMPSSASRTVDCCKPISYSYNQQSQMSSEARAEFNLPNGSWGTMDGPYSLGADYDKHDKSGLSIRPPNGSQTSRGRQRSLISRDVTMRS